MMQDHTIRLEQVVEERTAQRKVNAERECLIAAVTSSILSSLDLPTTFNTLVCDVQALIDCDRVAIWQIQPDCQALVVAESVSSGIESLMGRLIHSACFAKDTSEEAFRTQVRDVTDGDTTEGLSACRRGLIDQLHTRASALFPIIHHHIVWGFLEASEIHDPRQWQPEEETLLERLTTKLSIAVELANKHQQLKESEQRYANLAAMVPVGIFRTDTDGHCTYTNERWHQISGLTKEDIDAIEWTQVVHPDDGELVRTAWERTIDENIPFSLEFRFQKPEGVVTWVYGLAEAERDCNGNTVGYVGTFTDITKRRIAEANLSQLNRQLEVVVEERTQDVLAQEAQLLDLFENATDLIQGLSPDGRILFVNRAWKQTLGYSEDEIKTMSIFQIIHPLDVAHCQTVMARLSTGEQCLGIEARFLAKDGREIMLEGNVNCRFQDGKPIAIRGIFRDITERHKAEKSLRESQQLLQTVLDTFPLAVFWKDRNSVILGCNQRFAEFSGMTSPAHCIGKRNYDFGCTDSQTRKFLADDQNVIKTGIEKLGVEEAITLRSGEQRWVEINKLPLQDLTGKIVGMLGTYQDVSSRRLAEAALEASEVFNRNLIEEFPIGLVSYRTNGEINYANSTFTKILGRSFQDILSSSYSDLTPAKYAAMDAEQMQILEMTGGYGPYEKEYIHGDGHLVPVILTGTLLRQGNENIIWTSIQDISERKRAEREIHGLSERLTIALKSAAIGCWEWDIQRNEIVWDQRMHELYGLEPSCDILPFDAWRGALHPKDRSTAEGLLQQAVAGEKEFDTEFRVIHPDGSIHFLKANGLVVHDDEGTPLRMVGVNFDINDRKTAEDQLQRSNQELVRATRLKDEFLANMSHELRTPLNAILGMTEGLKDEVFGEVNKQQLESLQTIEASGFHLLSLINDILDVAKIESGKLKPDLTMVSIVDLCTSSLAFVKELAQRKNISIKATYTDAITSFSGDERLLRQVLINLLSNAVKFTPEAGVIKLSTSLVPSPDASTGKPYFRIAVEDSGIGIAKKDFNKLFKPFVQIDSALNREYAGTGLGLALVQKIVDLHDGRIHLTSKLGKGSCFAIDLPFDPVPSRPERTSGVANKTSAAEAPDASSKSPLILLAEDNEASEFTISSYLVAKGFRVISAKNGSEAIAMAYASKPDLILMDIQMSVMDGLTAIRKLRQDPGLSTLPIIALTALAMESDRERCMEAGATDYLSKPVRLKELTAHILELV